MSARKSVDLNALRNLEPFFQFLRYSMDSYAEMEAIFGEDAGHLWQRYAANMFDMTAWFYSLDTSNQRKVVEWHNGERVKTGQTAPINGHDAADFCRAGHHHITRLQQIVDHYNGEAKKPSKKRRRSECAPSSPPGNK